MPYIAKQKNFFFLQINVVGVGQRHTGYFYKTGGNKPTLGFTSNKQLMRTGGGDGKMAYVIYWSRAVVMDVLLFYNLAGIMEKNIVPFPLSPAK
jgi:hypothetical protein